VYTVTGNGDPSPNGDFFENGTAHGQPAYSNADASWWLWYSDAIGGYVLSPAIDDVEIYWDSDLGTADGVYTPSDIWTGNPVVIAV